MPSKKKTSKECLFPTAGGAVRFGRTRTNLRTLTLSTRTSGRNSRIRQNREQKYGGIVPSKLTGSTSAPGFPISGAWNDRNLPFRL